MSKICQNCGFQLDEAMNFCPKCRTKYTPPKAVAPSQGPAVFRFASPAPTQPSVDPAPAVSQVVSPAPTPQSVDPAPAVFQVASPAPTPPSVDPAPAVVQVTSPEQNQSPDTKLSQEKIDLTTDQELALLRTVMDDPGWSWMGSGKIFEIKDYSNGKVTIKFKNRKVFLSFFVKFLLALSIFAPIFYFCFMNFIDQLFGFTATIPVSRKNGTLEFQLDQLVLTKHLTFNGWLLCICSNLFFCSIATPITFWIAFKRKARQGKEDLLRRLEFANFCMKSSAAFLPSPQTACDFRGKSSEEIAAAVLPSWQQGVLPDMEVNRAPNLNSEKLQRLCKKARVDINPADVICQVSASFGKKKNSQFILTKTGIVGTSKWEASHSHVGCLACYNVTYGEMTLCGTVGGALALETTRLTFNRKLTIIPLEWNPSCDQKYIDMYREMIQFIQAMQATNA